MDGRRVDWSTTALQRDFVTLALDILNKKRTVSITIRNLRKQVKTELYLQNDRWRQGCLRCRDRLRS